MHIFLGAPNYYAFIACNLDSSSFFSNLSNNYLSALLNPPLGGAAFLIFFGFGLVFLVFALGFAFLVAGFFVVLVFDLGFFKLLSII